MQTANEAVPNFKDHSKAFIVSRSFDLLAICNLWWIAALIAVVVGGMEHGRLEFWQLYFLTVPHRWLTLLLVATDKDRRENRKGLFLAIAILAAVIVFGVQLHTGSVVCLLLVDYVWNAWHFGAQHYGVLRIYSRRAGIRDEFCGKVLLRTVVMYTVLRLVPWSTGWAERSTVATWLIHSFDIAALLLCIIAFFVESMNYLRHRTADSSPDLRLTRLTYLCSVFSMYMFLLLGIMWQWNACVNVLAVAAAAFHATEYLAIVTYYAKRVQISDSRSPFQQLANRWGAFLMLYISLLGGLSWIAETRLADLWLGINLWAAFVHYAFDGMIWKLRRSTTSQALGISTPRPVLNGSVCETVRPVQVRELMPSR